MLYYDHNDEVNGAVVENAIKSAIIKKIEEDEGKIEDCGLTVEDVKSDFNFLTQTHREKIEKLKEDLKKDENLDVDWDCEGDEDDYEGECR